jgi:pimeloyl-ACP methyl ester carboxylesterase
LIGHSTGRGYLYQLVGTWGWTSIPWLWSLRQPTLVMHGNDDPIVPLIKAKILALLIRKAKLHVVDDGHLFLVSQGSRGGPGGPKIFDGGRRFYRAKLSRHC